MAVPRAYPAGPSTDSHTVDPVLPGPSPHLNQDLGLAGPQPVGPLRLSVGLRLLVTKGDTQKADNATVPDHLWLRAFALGYGRESCLAHHHLALGMPLASLGGLKEPDLSAKGCGWEKAMPGFRTFGLRHWRHQLIIGFSRWRRENVPLQAHHPTPSLMVRVHRELSAGVVRAVYLWTAKGRRFYTLQWDITLRSTREGWATSGAGLDALRRCANASWFEWLEGSAPIYWNWPRMYQKEVRDGQQHFFMGLFGPPWLRPQRSIREADQHEMMRAKVVKVRKLDYITTGPVRSGTHFFCFPKGDTNIRMVYNGTSCGLSAKVWAPCFGLPTVKDTLRSLLPGYYQADLDVGNQFHLGCGRPVPQLQVT
jgi:hypothetical protein